MGIKIELDQTLLFDATTKITYLTLIHTEYFVCKLGSNPSTSNIRLIGGTENSGRVEIRHPESNEWGTICADGFDSNSARTICRMLCTSA